MAEIEKLDLKSMDITEDRLKKLKEIFPEVITDGKVDFERLRLTLGDKIETGKERYSTNWPGKADCFKIIQQPSIGTLKPCREESVDFDNTENLFIEGDNLEVLKSLQKSYYGKIKMIYIDPPYNTGNDFIYPDDYKENLTTYLQYTGQVDAEGKKFSTNMDTEGRFHSKWLNMMFPRLFLARNLLRDDGVIFTSIDDREEHNLRFMLNEVFGEENYLATFVWMNEGNIDNQSKIKCNHEYIVVYVRNEETISPPPVIDPNIPRSSKLFQKYIENTIVKNGPANPVSSVTLPIGFPANFESGTIMPKENFWPKLDRPVRVDNFKTQNDVTVSSGWSSLNIFKEFIKSGLKYVKDTKSQETTFYISETGAICTKKKRLENQSHVLTILRNMGTVQDASSKLANIGVDFSYPKPVELIKYLVKVGSDDDSILLDFFSGACPLAQATLELNSFDNGNRKFICVQLPEKTDVNSALYKAGYKTIADIGKERIRRVIKKIKKDTKQLEFDRKEMDLGVKVFKLGRSNFKVWDGNIDKKKIGQQLEFHIDHISSESTEEDILYEILLKAGFELTTKIDKIKLAEKDLFSIEDGAMLICLEKKFTKAVIKEMADLQPARVICLDKGFKGNDQLKTNAVQIMKSKGVEFRTV